MLAPLDNTAPVGPAPADASPTARADAGSGRAPSFAAFLGLQVAAAGQPPGRAGEAPAAEGGRTVPGDAADQAAVPGGVVPAARGDAVWPVDAAALPAAVEQAGATPARALQPDTGEAAATATALLSGDKTAAPTGLTTLALRAGNLNALPAGSPPASTGSSPSAAAATALLSGDETAAPAGLMTLALRAGALHALPAGSAAAGAAIAADSAAGPGDLAGRAGPAQTALVTAREAAVPTGRLEALATEIGAAGDLQAQRAAAEAQRTALADRLALSRTVADERAALADEALADQALARNARADTALAEDRARLLAALEGRPGAGPTGPSAATGGPSPGAAAPAGILAMLRQAANSGQTRMVDAGDESGLASTLQAATAERAVEPGTGRPPQAAPLPPRELNAALAQTLDQVAWMSKEGVHQARLQLEPAHLGRVDIRLDLEGGDARLHLGAQQPQVREALEALMPRLREALAEQGMNLTDASVSDFGREGPSEQAGQDDTRGAGEAFADHAGAGEDTDPARPGTGQQGLLDLFA